jgi:hypothetical protein
MSRRPDEHHDKLDGSCQWIEEREDFQNWRDAFSKVDTNDTNHHVPSIYWVTANPGAGKTVLAAHIISQLEEFGLEHAFHHFHVGKKASQSLAGFMRSMAFQMAVTNAAVRDVLAKLFTDCSTLDEDDAHAVWSRVFRSGILQVRSWNPLSALFGPGMWTHILR